MRFFALSTAEWGFATSAVAAVAAIIATLVQNRKSGPGPMQVLLDGNNALIGRLNEQIESMSRHVDDLERRVATLEQENHRYHRLYGPLPEQGQAS